MNWGNDGPNLGGVSGDGVPRSGPGSLTRTGSDLIGISIICEDHNLFRREVIVFQSRKTIETQRKSAADC
jgi:hypothetical protein